MSSLFHKYNISIQCWSPYMFAMSPRIGYSSWNIPKSIRRRISQSLHLNIIKGPVKIELCVWDRWDTP